MFKDVDPPSTWTYTVRTTPKSTSAYINDASGGKVRMQLPRCRVPFGLQESINAASDKEENRSRPNLELDVADPALVAWGDAVNAAAVEYVAANSKELMKKSMKKDFVEQLFRPAITPSRNSEYNPLMRTKVTKNGPYATRVRLVTDAGSSTTPLCHMEGTINDIEKGDEIIPIVEVSNIWFANNSAGITITLVNALLFKKSNDMQDEFTVEGVAGVEAVTTAAAAAPLPQESGTITVNLRGDENDFVANDPFA
jgi:hypothetical protein